MRGGGGGVGSTLSQQILQPGAEIYQSGPGVVMGRGRGTLIVADPDEKGEIPQNVGSPLKILGGTHSIKSVTNDLSTLYFWCLPNYSLADKLLQGL